jgi:hypothetical protein
MVWLDGVNTDRKLILDLFLIAYKFLFHLC